MLIQHVDPPVVHRPADGDITRHLFCPLQAVAGDGQSGLGRSVLGAHGKTGSRIERLPQRDRREHLTARVHIAHPGKDVGRFIDEHPEQAAGEHGAGHPVALDEFLHALRIQVTGRGDHQLPLPEQRRPDLTRRRVERQRRLHQHPFQRRVLHGAVECQADRTPVGHQNALGNAGRARCVQDVGGLLGQRLAVEVVRDHAVSAVLRHEDRLHGPLRRLVVGMLRVGQQDPDVRGRHDAEHAFRRMRQVQRKVAAACLERRQDGDDELRRPVHQDGHRLFMPDAGPDQPMGERVGPGVQFGEGQRDLAAHHRHRIRCRQDPRLEELDQGVLADRALSAAGGLQQGLAFLAGQQLHTGQRGVRFGGERRQQSDQTIRQRRDRRAVEQIGVVRDLTDDPRWSLTVLLTLSQGDRKIEPGGARRADPGCGLVVHAHTHLDQRAPPGVLRQVDDLCQPLHGHVMDRASRTAGLACPLHQLSQSRIP